MYIYLVLIYLLSGTQKNSVVSTFFFVTLGRALPHNY